MRVAEYSVKLVFHINVHSKGGRVNLRHEPSCDSSYLQISKFCI